MYVGVQGIGTSQHELHFLLRHGVTHMDTQVDPDNLDRIAQQREEADREHRHERGDDAHAQRGLLDAFPRAAGGVSGACSCACSPPSPAPAWHAAC